MNKEEIKLALERLEEKLHDSNGYKAPQILFEMGIPVTADTQKKLRGALRKMMRNDDYANPGAWDIVYTPGGWGSGTYRLTKFRDNIFDETIVIETLKNMGLKYTDKHFTLEQILTELNVEVNAFNKEQLRKILDQREWTYRI